ncbi:hypothetical protein CLIB1444_20S00914 [[Candida] jaroonii]|uniref:Uncharacterized protein n=1 Tax=[Candida] jaroonii TaxID=467808 RepID=A0ACA9YGB7_9ASCO|nr:hypothetical protein CLIB1444_20S00914 [[Candida] jaroonii]
MSGFPKIPFFKGDTDDDASIHLNSKVGPANPLPKLKNTDKEMLKILNENDDDDDEFNNNFELFKKGLLKFGKEREEKDDSDEVDDEDQDFTPDEDEEEDQGEEIEEETDNELNDFDDDTEVEEDTDEKEEIIDLKATSKHKTEHIVSKFNISTISYIVIFIQFLLIIVVLFNNKKSNTINNFQDLNLKFDEIDYEIVRLNKFNEGLSKNNKMIESNLNDLNSNLNSKFDIISKKFNDINNEISKTGLKDFKQIDKLSKDVETLQKNVKNSETLGNLDEFDSQLDIINGKLSQLQELSQNVETFKEKIIDDIVKILPQYLPIYMDKGKIHYVPEFNKYLYNFIESYTQEANVIKWEDFLNENKQYLTQYIQKLVSEVKDPLPKHNFEKYIKEKMNENNRVIYDKLNQLIDNINFNTTNVKLSSDKIMLDNLMDIFSKGSINTNYADYKLGSRILGFLTQIPNRERSLNRKIFLGWYDYLISSSPSVINLKSNANNVLIDGGDSWQCNMNKFSNEKCSIGIKLSSSIILTDLLIKKVEHQSKVVSIYLKPSTKREYEKLLQYLKEFRINFEKPTNKYLNKFIKVKEIEMDQLVNHIKLPISLVNLQIPIREVYLEFNEDIEINNIKAFGISEINAYKYSKEFESLVDHMKVDDNIEVLI